MNKELRVDRIGSCILMPRYALTGVSQLSERAVKEPNTRSTARAHHRRGQGRRRRGVRGEGGRGRRRRRGRPLARRRPHRAPEGRVGLTVLDGTRGVRIVLVLCRYSCTVIQVVP